jgi:hypothetical protein
MHIFDTLLSDAKDIASMTEEGLWATHGCLEKPVLLVSSGVLQGRYFVDCEGVGDALEKTCHGMSTS